MQTYIGGDQKSLTLRDILDRLQVNKPPPLLSGHFSARVGSIPQTGALLFLLNCPFCEPTVQFPSLRHQSCLYEHNCRSVSVRPSTCRVLPQTYHYLSLASNIKPRVSLTCYICWYWEKLSFQSACVLNAVSRPWLQFTVLCCRVARLEVCVSVPFSYWLKVLQSVKTSRNLQFDGL